MFCPQCGAKQSDELRFCKSCGANLYAVRQVVASPETGEKFDWSKTWVAEMFLSESERKRRQEEIDRQRGITPEVKRYNEIKAGVITGCVGIGLAIFLKVFFEGVILGGNVPPNAVEIIRRLWIVGVIPFLVGIGLIFNGLFVSRSLVKILQRESETGPDALAKGPEPHALRSADTTEFVPSPFSVTEETTKHLGSSGQKQ
jgi:hypothetical protein